jgi:hypothetical protein
LLEHAPSPVERQAPDVEPRDVQGVERHDTGGVHGSSGAPRSSQWNWLTRFLSNTQTSPSRISVGDLSAVMARTSSRKRFGEAAAIPPRLQP